MLLYSTGIRLSELSYLRIADIDSKNMRIKVVQGKGAKDRYTILSESVLLELRAYYVQYKPVEYLFNGMGKGLFSAEKVFVSLLYVKASVLKKVKIILPSQSSYNLLNNCRLFSLLSSRIAFLNTNCFVSKMPMLPSFSTSHK